MQPCSTSDYLPTILEIAGVNNADLHELDGESFMKFFVSKDTPRNNPLVFCSDDQGAVVSSDFKLYSGNGNVELYNLNNDPEEENNIAASHPYKVEKLSLYLHHQMDVYRDSFEGKEYGLESVKRMNQKWHDIFKVKE